MISIVTAAHRVLPWYNLRLISVCAQEYDDWEWIIFDNSPNGEVSKYVDEFFYGMQGTHYLWCKNKIKCYHDPMNDVTLSKGRIGMCKNMAAKLSSCKMDEFLLFLDSDDFLYPNLLQDAHEAFLQNPKSEGLFFMLDLCLAQNIFGGNFDFCYDYKGWINNTKYNKEKLNELKEYGFDKLDGYYEFEKKVLSEKKNQMDCAKIINYKHTLSFPYTTVSFSFDDIITMNPDGINFFDTFLETVCFVRKKDFWRVTERMGFNESCSQDDCVALNFSLLNNPIFLKKPGMSIVAPINDNTGKRDSATTQVMSDMDNNENNIVDNVKSIYEKYYRKRYDKFGFNPIVPIVWE